MRAWGETYATKYNSTPAVYTEKFNESHIRWVIENFRMQTIDAIIMRTQRAELTRATQRRKCLRIKTRKTTYLQLNSNLNEVTNTLFGFFTSFYSCVRLFDKYIESSCFLSSQESPSVVNCFNYLSHRAIVFVCEDGWRYRCTATAVGCAVNPRKTLMLLRPQDRLKAASHCRADAQLVWDIDPLSARSISQMIWNMRLLYTISHKFDTTAS